MYGTTVQSTVENGTKTRLTEEVFMNGLMEECMMVSGKTTICMAEAPIPGRMVGSMKENISMIGNMVSESTPGKTVVNTLDTGKMENNMEMALIKCLMVKKRRDSGKMVKESSGWMNEKLGKNNNETII